MDIGLYDEKFQKEFKEKMLDLYNFLVREKTSGGKIRFKNGIVFECKIDLTNMKDKRVIDLRETESEGKL